MPDTDRLINKAQGDDIITALNGITSRLQEMYTVDSALSSTSEHPVQNKVVKSALDNKADESDLADKADKSDIASTQTATGNPLALTDCAPINAESLKVELEPKQDLHGYDYPWVGGAGKNKLPMTVDGIKAANTEGTWSGNAYTRNGVTYTILTDDGGNVTGININGTNNQSSYASLWICDYAEIPGQCIVNGWAVSGDPNSAYVQINKKPIGGGAASIEGYLYTDQDTLNLSDTSYLYTYIIYVPSGKTVNNLLALPMIRLSTETDATFAPYSNICPITGYTECEVDDVGKNFLDTSTITKSDITFTEDVNGYITASPNNADSRNWGYSYCQYTDIELEAGTYNIDWWASTLSSSQYKAICVFDTSDNMLVYAENFGESGTSQFTLSEKTIVGVEAKILDSVVRIQIRESTAPQTYSPYASTSATIQFGQTVYGGSVDFLTGVLTVDSGIIASYNGETLPSTWISDRDVYVAGTTPTTGAQVCYNLAEPTTIQLTPTELKLLLKYNNITTNGTTITLGYQPDNVIGELKGEIQQCIPDPYYMTFDVDSNITDAVPIIFDQATHDYNIVGDGWKDKTFLCIESVDMRMGTLQRILSSDICFVDSALKTILLFPYIRAVEQNVKLSITESSGTYKLSYQSTADASATDYIKFRVRVFN